MTDGSYSSLLSALPKISHFSASMSTASSCNSNTENQPLLTVTKVDCLSLKHTRWVTSSTYSSRSRAFLKSYSLARLLSSQMYNCGEQTESRGCQPTGRFLLQNTDFKVSAWVCFHLYEVVSAQHRHGVGVLLLLLQQLSGQSLLMQQEAFLLHDVWSDRYTTRSTRCMWCSSAFTSGRKVRTLIKIIFVHRDLKEAATDIIHFSSEGEYRCTSFWGLMNLTEVPTPFLKEKPEHEPGGPGWVGLEWPEHTFLGSVVLLPSTFLLSWSSGRSDASTVSLLRASSVFFFTK